MILLDTTVLSNFARIGRLDLVRLAVPDALVTPQVLVELKQGVQAGYLPAQPGRWPTTTLLTSTEEAHRVQLSTILGDGESSCLAILIERGGILFSDDLEARRYAQRHGIAVSGTLGILTQLVKTGHLALAQADALLQEMIGQGYRSPVASLKALLRG